MDEPQEEEWQSDDGGETKKENIKGEIEGNESLEKQTSMGGYNINENNDNNDENNDENENNENNENNEQNNQIENEKIKQENNVGTNTLEETIASDSEYNEDEIENNENTENNENEKQNTEEGYENENNSNKNYVDNSTDFNEYTEEGDNFNNTNSYNNNILIHDLGQPPGTATSNTEERERIGKVIIEWDTTKKPFLGGFRNKKTGVEYHHASTQTYRPTSLRVLQKMLITKFHRDTQTTETVHNRTQPMREHGTQMAKKGIYISDEGCKVLYPRPYFTADQLFDLKTRKAIKIQCMVRRWFARRKVQRLRQQRDETNEQLLLQQQEKDREMDDVRQREIERRRNPRTKEDFDVLYRELEAWHQQETARIIENTEEGSEERKIEMYSLLQKQTQLLQTIDRLKLQAKKANEGPRIAQNLSQMAAPKKWGSTGVQVTTPYTVRAQELMVLYQGLKDPLLTVDQRLDVLLHVKWTVKEFATQLTKDIIELIDREADLLNRGRSEKSVEALRQRISNLFLKFIETPEFNPEAANLKSNKTKFSQPTN